MHYFKNIELRDIQTNKSFKTVIMKIRATLFILLLCTFSMFAAEVDTIKVFSKSMNKTISNVIITPDGYHNSNEKYAVLYLLHGAGGDHANWLNRVPNIQQYADQFNLIIVCPDGDKGSWYFDSPMDENFRYETYISKELITAIDKQYNTITNKSGRAITGLSMGGHGAFYLAFRNQDIWGAAGSMSGGVDIRPFPNGWGLPKRLGSYAEHKNNWESNTVYNLVHLLDGKKLQIIFDCGVDDFFYTVNKNLHLKMVERNIPHTYIERPGKHNWDYWENAIKYQLVFFNDFFNSKN